MKYVRTEDWVHHSETETFNSLQELEDDLYRTATADYAEAVIMWAQDATQDRLIINNGPNTEDRYDKVT